MNIEICRALPEDADTITDHGDFIVTSYCLQSQITIGHDTDQLLSLHVFNHGD